MSMSIVIRWKRLLCVRLSDWPILQWSKGVWGLCIFGNLMPVILDQCKCILLTRADCVGLPGQNPVSDKTQPVFPTIADPRYPLLPVTMTISRIVEVSFIIWWCRIAIGLKPGEPILCESYLRERRYLISAAIASTRTVTMSINTNTVPTIMPPHIEHIESIISLFLRIINRLRYWPGLCRLDIPGPSPSQVPGEETAERCNADSAEFEWPTHTMRTKGPQLISNAIGQLPHHIGVIQLIFRFL